MFISSSVLQQLNLSVLHKSDLIQCVYYYYYYYYYNYKILQQGTLNLPIYVLYSIITFPYVLCVLPTPICCLFHVST